MQKERTGVDSPVEGSLSPSLTTGETSLTSRVRGVIGGKMSSITSSAMNTTHAQVQSSGIYNTQPDILLMISMS